MKLHYVLGFSLLCAVSYAGTITHTDYTAGNVITAAGQNTNENAIVNEFNGNISAANLASNAVTTAKITDANVTLAKLDTALQSTFTYVNTLGAYRRPNLTFINVSLVDVEPNTGTLNQTCILFPDSQRCVTEDTSSSNKYRRFDITAVANYTAGTEDSGLVTGLTEGTSTWYAIYAVKSQINSSNFVLVGDTTPATQASYSNLNNRYGLNGWVYLGRIHNGDGTSGSATSDIQSFKQTGAIMKFSNRVAGSTIDFAGFRMATSAGTSSLTYQAANGVTGIVIPAEFLLGWYCGGAGAGSTSTNIRERDQAVTLSIGIGTVQFGGCYFANLGFGLTVTNGSSVSMDIVLGGFIDPQLGVGSNPQL
jgi:hypothetical protein